MTDLKNHHPTSRRLFHARLAKRGSKTLNAIKRTCCRSLNPNEKAPAEIVTWRDGLFDVWGILVDPGLGDVPIEARGWFRWSCRRTLLKKHQEAEQFGEHLAVDTYING